MIISLVSEPLRTSLLFLHHLARCSFLCLFAEVLLSVMRPTTVVLSADTIMESEAWIGKDGSYSPVSNITVFIGDQLTSIMRQWPFVLFFLFFNPSTFTDLKHGSCTSAEPCLHGLHVNKGSIVFVFACKCIVQDCIPLNFVVTEFLHTLLHTLHNCKTIIVDVLQ